MEHRFPKSWVALLKSLFDTHHEGVLATDSEGRIIYYNAAQSRIDDISPENAIGKTMCQVFNIAEERSPTMHVLKTRHAAFDDVHFYRTQYGRLVNSMCHIYPIIIEGEMLGALSFIQEYSFLQKDALESKELPKLMLRPSNQSTKKASNLYPKGRSGHFTFSHIIGKSEKLQNVIRTAKQVTKSLSSVMLIGETGVGKEVFARSIHNDSPRHAHLFTAINCSAIPETLLEGILFGTIQGAFTGAENKAGLFENACGGTVLLDEVDSMPIGLQSKLLRVLQEMRVRRVGDLHERPIDVKILSSIGRSPEECITEGYLRRDFYYRLGVVQLTIPPLRERMEDIPLLAKHFIDKHAKALGISPPLLSPEVMEEFYN